MTLSTTVSKKVFVTDASAVAFPFPYKFWSTSDLVVTKYTIADGTEEVLTIEDDYAVTGTDDGLGGTTNYETGGTVTLTAAAGVGYKLIVERTLPITQEFDFAPNSDFSEDSFEEELDRINAILQQQQTLIDRCIKMDISNTSVSGVFDVNDLTVEIPAFIVGEQTEKTSISGNDYVAIADSADSNVNKKVKVSTLVDIHNQTEKATLHANDVFLLEDSQATYAKKKIKFSDLTTGIVSGVASDVADIEADILAKFNTSTGHDHDGTDGKLLNIANITGGLRKTIYLTGSGNFTAPAGVTRVYVSMCGGGGAGSDTAGGGGGGGASVLNLGYTVVPGNTYAYSVGAGGAASEAAGGDSTFGTGVVLTAKGGTGANDTTGGAGGVATLSGSGITAGGYGFAGGTAGNCISVNGGGGGGSYFGGGGAGGGDGIVGTAASANSGGGGGGGGNLAGHGDGGSGIIILEY